MIDPLVSVYKDLAAYRKIQEQLRTIETGVGDPASLFLSLPGLVGFWPMSGVDVSSGDAYDISGQGRRLTYNGNPTYNIYNNLIAYIDLDGTGDYLSRVDESDLDITGTEAHNATAIRGLTMGGWFWSDITSTDQNLIGKWNATGNLRAYTLNLTADNSIAGHVSTNGTTQTTVSSTAAIAAGEWFWAAMRFTPSAELANWSNDTKTINTTSIPASIFNSSAELQIGARDAGTTLLNGRASLCFLCANALPDTLIDYLFQETRGCFSV